MSPLPNTRTRQTSIPDRKSVFAGLLNAEKPSTNAFKGKSGTISTISCGNSPANNNFNISFNLNSFGDYLNQESSLSPTLRNPSAQRRTTKGYTSQGFGAYNSQSFLKDAILSNMQKNSEAESPPKQERRHHTDYRFLNQTGFSDKNAKKPTIILSVMAFEDGLDVNIEDNADDENHLMHLMESLNRNNGSNPTKSIQFN